MENSMNMTIRHPSPDARLAPGARLALDARLAPGARLALDARLALAASFVRPGHVICDVGTDHAYLPIWLITNGICPRAVACDIREGPLSSARAHAAEYGCTDRIALYRADGLADIPLEAENVREIVICGMGGELIARILSESPYSRRPGVRAILQPASSDEDLRLLLAQRGYRIEDERLAIAAGRVYTCMLTVYDGVERTFTPAQLMLGVANIQRGYAAGVPFEEYLRRAVRATEKKRGGLAVSGRDTEKEDALLTELYAIAEKENVKL